MNVCDIVLNAKRLPGVRIGGRTERCATSPILRFLLIPDRCYGGLKNWSAVLPNLIGGRSAKFVLVRSDAWLSPAI